MLIKWFVRGLTAVPFAAVLVVVAFAGANLTPDPWGNDLGGEFSDGNGELVEEHPGPTATWAHTKGNLKAKDPLLTKTASGGAIDRKRHVGGIQEAVLPGWIWELQAGMQTSSGGFQGGSFTQKLEGKGRAVLVYHGEGATVIKAAETKTSNQQQIGAYDIEEDVTADDGTTTTHTIQNGGQCWAPAWPGGGAGGGERQITVDQQFAKLGATIAFQYESRATGSMELDFSVAGNERVGFNVENYNWIQTEHEWAGIAVAWDFNPLGTHPIQAFILDPQP